MVFAMGDIFISIPISGILMKFISLRSLSLHGEIFFSRNEDRS
jgi:hypothetical protein